VQVAIPDVASLPLNVTPTGLLYQPFASGPRLNDAPVTFGGVASRLIVNCDSTFVWGGVLP
jgi:hypothetical protein